MSFVPPQRFKTRQDTDTFEMDHGGSTVRQRVATFGAASTRGRRSRTAAWAVALGFVALVAGGVVAGMGSVLTIVYPAAALLVGTLLYRRNPPLYLGFTWWIWLLTPEVRRLIDYRSGWDATNPVMLAPFVVAVPIFFTLLRHSPKLQLPFYLPMGLVFFGLLYGYGVGVLRAGPAAATYDLLNWLVPAVFVFYFAVHWRRYPQYRRTLRLVFAWGVLLLGLYGLWQFASPPPWDRYWMESAPIDSIGYPEPFQVRVYSTLNSPGPFAVVMMTGLLLLLGWGSRLRWPTVGAGMASFLLSLVRSAWGGWIVGVLFVVTRSQRLRGRLLVTLLAVMTLALPLLSVGPLADSIGTRLGTLTDLGQDTSLRARLQFYADFAPQAFLTPLGDGLGGTGLSTKLGGSGEELGELGNFDSGVMNIPFVLGWPGTLLYGGGLTWLVFRALGGGPAQRDPFVVTSGGIVVAVLAQLVFANFLLGVTGLVFWSFLGLSLAARLYYRAYPEEDVGLVHEPSSGNLR